MGERTASEAKWEKKLNISTAAGAYEREDAHHARYQPTDYAVLERLAASGWIDRADTLVDYGCGKGRVGFFLNHCLGCSAIGVEYDAALCEQAERNLAAYSGRGSRAGSLRFECCAAENYVVQDADAFYFFNPFSVKILQAVVRRILDSYYARPRRMHLFFYYVLDAHLSWLMTEAELSFAGEIDCRDLYHNDDSRERIMIFSIG